MKKITLILCFLVTSLGFAQVLENWDGPAPTLGSANGAPLPTIVTDPGPGAVKGNVLEVITTNAGQPWQQAELTFQPGFNLDLTGPTKFVSIDWYSTTPFDALIRADARVSGGGSAAATAEAAHPGGGWQTLIFDFNQQAQALGIPNGVYSQLYFFNLWNITLGDFNNPAVASTTYIDIIRDGIPPLTTWTGSVNSNWNIAGNWDNGVPTATVSAIIPNTANAPTATGAITAADIFIESGASLIANGTVTGTVTYERNLPSSNWHYISSPVVGQDVDNFVAASGLQSGGLDASLCTFDTAANDWNFYQLGTANTDVLNPGEGYIVNLTAASGDISFSGTMNVGNVTKPLATTGQGYNLLGNPYPSYIDSSAMLTASSGALLSQTIWVWNQAINDYEEKVTADNFKLAPGQGFFIQSNGAAGSVAINEGFQSHEADTFLRSAERTEVYLTLSNGATTKRCKLYYIAGTTTGFDNGYDGPTFRAFPEPLSIYTHLVTNNFGMDIGLQSLPNDDYENLVIPVGIDAIAGTEITVSASSINLPAGIDIYLEDRAVNTFTLLNANSDFTLTPENDLNGTGRFYLHTNSDTLGLNENTLAAYDLQIFTTDASKQIIIKGQLSSNTTNADLYDLHGKLIFSQTLDQSRTTNTLDISGLSSGLYVVKVEGGNQSKTQKVLIK